MRLRRPCEHYRYERHDFFNTEGWDGPNGLERHAPIVSCPGGEFLPEDALVIEKANGEWTLTNEGFAAAEDAYLTLTGKVSMRGLESALFAYLDALPDQVGEPG